MIALPPDGASHDDRLLELHAKVLDDIAEALDIEAGLRDILLADDHASLGAEVWPGLNLDAGLADITGQQSGTPSGKPGDEEAAKSVPSSERLLNQVLRRVRKAASEFRRIGTAFTGDGPGMVIIRDLLGKIDLELLKLAKGLARRRTSHTQAVSILDFAIHALQSQVPGILTRVHPEDHGIAAGHFELLESELHSLKWQVVRLFEASSADEDSAQPSR